MQLERIESGPAWADKTVADYSDTSVTRARKWAEEQLLGGDADRTVEAWPEVIGTMSAEDAVAFCVMLNRKNSHETRIAALNLVIDQFLKDEYIQRLVESMAESYLEAGA